MGYVRCSDAFSGIFRTGLGCSQSDLFKKRCLKTGNFARVRLEAPTEIHVTNFQVLPTMFTKKHNYLGLCNGEDGPTPTCAGVLCRVIGRKTERNTFRTGHA